MGFNPEIGKHVLGGFGRAKQLFFLHRKLETRVFFGITDTQTVFVSSTSKPFSAFLAVVGLASLSSPRKVWMLVMNRKTDQECFGRFCFL